jgi:hypothetical protein
MAGLFNAFASAMLTGLMTTSLAIRITATCLGFLLGVLIYKFVMCRESLTKHGKSKTDLLMSTV